MSVVSPQCGQLKLRMFSMMPRIGTCTFSNMRRPRRAIFRLTAWGVVTITTPYSGMLCASVNWVSPVPGGRSRIRQSSSPHCTPAMNIFRYLPTIGPRRTAG